MQCCAQEARVDLLSLNFNPEGISDQPEQQENWSGCPNDIAGFKKKKRANVSVNIIVSENVSL